MFLYKRLEIFSWIFIIITIWTIIMLAISGYNYYIYGNCNGEQSDEFCIFDPSGANSKITDVNDASCGIEGIEEKRPELTIQHLDIHQFPSKGSGQRLILFGCYGCAYTRELMPTIKNILKEHEIEYVFVHFSTHAGAEFLHTYEYCMQEQDANKYWEFNDALFAMNMEESHDEQKIKELAQQFIIDEEKFNTCIKSNETKQKLDVMSKQLEETHIYGTPTVYINGEFIVGPKPQRVYERLLK